MDVTILCKDGERSAPLDWLLQFQMPKTKQIYDRALLAQLELADFTCAEVAQLMQLVCAATNCQPVPQMYQSTLTLMDFLGAPPWLWERLVSATKWSPHWPHSPELVAVLNQLPAGAKWKWFAVTPDTLVPVIEWLRAAPGIELGVPGHFNTKQSTEFALEAHVVLTLTGQETTPINYNGKVAAAVRKMRARPEDCAAVRAEHTQRDTASNTLLINMPWEDFPPALAFKVLCCCVRAESASYRKPMVVAMLEFGAVFAHEVADFARECEC